MPSQDRAYFAQEGEQTAHSENTVTIERPVRQVFGFVLDGTKNPLWRAGVTDIERVVTVPTGGVGTKFKQGMKGPGGRIDADYEIVKCEPNALIEFQVTAGPARPKGTYRFRDLGQSTQVEFILDLQPKGFGRLMDPMINRQMQAEVGTLANLKAYLEGQRQRRQESDTSMMGSSKLPFCFV